MMTGLSMRYELGSPHDQVGRPIADKSIRQGNADVLLYDLMQEGAGVLLDGSTNSQGSELVMAATSRVRCIAVDAGPSVLIRPDACIAWIGEGESIDGLEEALRCWFGAPRKHSSLPRPEP